MLISFLEELVRYGKVCVLSSTRTVYSKGLDILAAKKASSVSDLIAATATS